MPRSSLFSALLCLLLLLSGLFVQSPAHAESLRIAYLVSDLRIPFWSIMARGIQAQARQQGIEVQVLSADNSAKAELQNLVQAMQSGVDGLIVSPTTSSACVTLLKLASRVGIPVVVADIGSDEKGYVSYISSDNEQGSYELGKIVAHKLQARGWGNGTVGIVAIPQKRLNGQARTAGFMRALTEAGIKGAGLLQQVDFSYDETYRHSLTLLQQHPDMRVIWLQGSDRYQGALDAIADQGRTGEVLVATFDAEPEFLELIPRQVLLGAAMQQPYLIGERAMQTLVDHLAGKAVSEQIKMPVLAVDDANISAWTETIRRNVLGLIEVDASSP